MFNAQGYNDLNAAIERLNELFKSSESLQKHGIPIVFLECDEGMTVFKSHNFYAFQVYLQDGKMPIFNTEHDQYGYLPELLAEMKGKIFIFEKTL